jgi:non-ribosomal peptide synthetase component E (peptide arylation enzyme)
LLTDDICEITKDNGILITDRKRYIITRDGENLSAKEIEDVLHDNPMIKEAAAVSMPHERLGEGVCAYIILIPDSAVDIGKIIA